jgi:hypothetical protein
LAAAALNSSSFFAAATLSAPTAVSFCLLSSCAYEALSY